MQFKIIMILFFSVHISLAQEIQTKFVSKKTLKADRFIGVDDLENTFYLINNTLFKKNDQETISYSNVKLGNLTTVHIQNPFKIILFYKDFNKVVLLDNKLNELTDAIEFTKADPFNNVQFVSPSSENNLWLLADDQKIHLFDYQKYVDITETQVMDFYQKTFMPVAVQSTYKYIWVFSKNGVLTFNEYGTFIDFSDVPDFDFIAPYKNGFIYSWNNSMQYLHKGVHYPLLKNSDTPFKNIFINGQTIYTFDGANLYQYNIL